MNELIKIPKSVLFVLNQVFEIENKLQSISESNSIQRNIDKIKDYFEYEAMEDNAGLSYHNPFGEAYNETRTDLEASIAGNSTENLFITEVIKPIIRYRKGGMNAIAQKGVVIVETKNTNS